MYIKHPAQCLPHSKYSINSSCYDKDDGGEGDGGVVVMTAV